MCQDVPKCAQMCHRIGICKTNPPRREGESHPAPTRRDPRGASVALKGSNAQNEPTRAGGGCTQTHPFAPVKPEMQNEPTDGKSSRPTPQVDRALAAPRWVRL